MKSRRRAVSGLVALAVIAGGAAAWRVFAPRPVQARVAVAAPTRGEFVVTIPADGILQSDDAVTVSTGKAPGELIAIVPDGSVVRAGEVFCSIEAADLERQEVEADLRYQQAAEEIGRTRETAQQEFEAANRAVEQAKEEARLWEQSNQVRIEMAQRQLEFDRAEAKRLGLEYGRAQRMADRGIIAASEAEVAKAALDAQTFKVEQSEKELELSRRQIASEVKQRSTAIAAAAQRAQIAGQRIGRMVERAEERSRGALQDLEKLRTALADRTVLAPASGVVSLFSRSRGGERRPWREGDVVEAKMPLGTISSSEHMSVRCRVMQQKIALLHPGQAAEMEFEAMPGRRFSGVVSAISAMAREVEVYEDPNASPNDRVFDVWAKLPLDAGGDLRPGLNARVHFIIKRLPDALSVPVEAVFERSGHSLVYVRRDGKFVPRRVEVGERNEAAAVVRSGLAPGEAVAMADPTPTEGKAK